MAAVSRCLSKGTFRFCFSWIAMPGSQTYDTWLGKQGADQKIGSDAVDQDAFTSGDMGGKHRR